MNRWILKGTRRVKRRAKGEEEKGITIMKGKDNTLGNEINREIMIPS